MNNPAPRVAIVMGVSGSGKTTIGRALASVLGWVFVDADDYHSHANIEKMRQSIPLTAQDREPWLDALVARLNAQPNERLVLACSALTHAIRERFRRQTRGGVKFVYLKLAAEHLRARLRARTGHYATLGLLDSQLATFEEPSEQEALTVNAEGSAQDICQSIVARLPRAQ